MNPLLAKSYDRQKHPSGPPDYALLRQHSRDVAEGCDALAKTIGPLALATLDLSQDSYPEFSRALKTNGWIQDTGKASSHFQEMLLTPGTKQLLRHETISGLLFWSYPELRDWLSSSLCESTLLMSLWGAMGHHRKFDDLTQPEQTKPLSVGLSHPDFAATLLDMAIDLKLPKPPLFEKDLIITRDGHGTDDLQALRSIRDLQDDFAGLEDNFYQTDKRRMIALIKALGIAADVAASAIAARGKDSSKYSVSKFIDETLRKVGLKPEQINHLICEWAWSALGASHSADRSSLPPQFKLRQFQSDVADSQSFLTLATAGCGSGKSLAAYLWAKRWAILAANSGRQNFRLFFCLPTTGTTTEHFKDYALESGIHASLTHSRSSVDLMMMMTETVASEECSDDTTDMQRSALAALNANRDKIESLTLWDTPLVVTTADTVLGLMSNARRAIYSFPAIINSAIVFDEIHSFDDRLFGHLIVFLKHFTRLPVLLMTASLPTDRLDALKAIRSDLVTIQGPPEFENLKRYHIVYPAVDGQEWRLVDECVRAGGKVLWVRNRVESANTTYRESVARFGAIQSCNIDVYHSRLRYKDRSRRHRQVIDAFRNRNKPSILVATQVAEMSLDLSADLLITDVAPIPSLIQRMGRLNRYSQPEAPQPVKTALVQMVQESDRLPYEQLDLDDAGKWLRALMKGDSCGLSQQDLSLAYADFRTPAILDIDEAEKKAIFFSGLWRTRVGLTREGGHTISVILEDDFLSCKDMTTWGEPTNEWIRGHEVAIPIREAVLRWRRFGNLKVAPQSEVAYDYDEFTGSGTGASWQN